MKERYGEEGLAGKMSCVQTGYFASSYKLAMKSYFSKVCFIFFIILDAIRRLKTVTHSGSLIIHTISYNEQLLSANTDGT